MRSVSHFFTGNYIDFSCKSVPKPDPSTSRKILKCLISRYMAVNRYYTVNLGFKVKTVVHLRRWTPSNVLVFDTRCSVKHPGLVQCEIYSCFSRHNTQPQNLISATTILWTLHDVSYLVYTVGMNISVHCISPACSFWSTHSHAIERWAWFWVAEAQKHVWQLQWALPKLSMRCQSHTNN